MDLRKIIRDSREGPLKAVKDLHRAVTRASLPAPPAVWVPIWRSLWLAQSAKERLWSGLVVTPVFHGLCREIGDDFVAGTFLPFVIGAGDVCLGDEVTVFGKVDFHFGSSGPGRPELRIGDHSVVGHMTTFSVSGRMRIGRHCLIAPRVSFTDCNGHPIDPDLRRQGVPPSRQDVRDVTIGDNVWIGDGALVLPGTTIGDNCVIGARARVSGDVPDNHMVVPPKAEVREIRRLRSVDTGTDA
ncbi:MAG: acyltransferase [Myxococcota bacterium]